MCVAAVAWNAHPNWLLVMAGNRDEHHIRPTSALAHWGDGSDIIAGKDLTSGGTWSGLTEASRFALVTNYRVAEGPQAGKISRGVLVTDLLNGSPLTAQIPIMNEINPFNLIHIFQDQATFLTNYPEVRLSPLTPGIHGFSNGRLDAPWPKTEDLTNSLHEWLDKEETNFQTLFQALRVEIPSVPRANTISTPEAKFASIFINNENYGTRSSTVLAIKRNGAGVVIERSFDKYGQMIGEIQIQFSWPNLTCSNLKNQKA